MKNKLLFIIIILMFCLQPKAQTINKDYILPGNGLKQHPFLYVGEWDVRNPTAQSMFLVTKSKEDEPFQEKTDLYEIRRYLI